MTPSGRTTSPVALLPLGEVAGAVANERTALLPEVGHDEFAALAVRQYLAGVGVDYLDESVVVADVEAILGGSLGGDREYLPGAEVIDRRPGVQRRLHVLAQPRNRGERLAGADESVDAPAGVADFQREGRVAEQGVDLVLLDRRGGLFGLPGTGGNPLGAEFLETALEDDARPEGVVPEGVEHAVAGVDAGGREHVGVSLRLPLEVGGGVEHGRETLAQRREAHHRGAVVQRPLRRVGVVVGLQLLAGQEGKLPELGLGVDRGEVPVEVVHCGSFELVIERGQRRLVHVRR